jgi:hypothetical protein
MGNGDILPLAASLIIVLPALAVLDLMAESLHPAQIRN